MARYKFSTTLPQEIMLSFYKPFKNLYFIIQCKNDNYPTFRCSTRFNRSVTVFGCEINVIIFFKKKGVRFPPYMVSGKSNNSNLNDQFLENLGTSLDLSKTCINKFNTAIDNSSSYYITKKIYGKDSSLFEFNETDNTYFDFRFGYQNEILGKVINYLKIDRFFIVL